MLSTPTTGTAVKALRPLFAWGLVGYVAVYLFFAFLGWIIPSGHDTFSSRAYFAGFVDLYTIVLPLLAVLIAAQIEPVLPAAKLIAGIALLEYAVALFFGVITFLIGLAYAFSGVDSFAESIGALRHFVMSILELGFLALAGYAVLRVFQSLGGRLPDVSSMRTQPPPAPPAPPAQ